MQQCHGKTIAVAGARSCGMVFPDRTHERTTKFEYQNHERTADFIVKHGDSTMEKPRICEKKSISGLKIDLAMRHKRTIEIGG